MDSIHPLLCCVSLILLACQFAELRHTRPRLNSPAAISPASCSCNAIGVPPNAHAITFSFADPRRSRAQTPRLLCIMEKSGQDRPWRHEIMSPNRKAPRSGILLDKLGQLIYSFSVVCGKPEGCACDSGGILSPPEIKFRNLSEIKNSKFKIESNFSSETRWKSKQKNVWVATVPRWRSA